MVMVIVAIRNNIICKFKLKCFFFRGERLHKYTHSESRRATQRHIFVEIKIVRRNSLTTLDFDCFIFRFKFVFIVVGKGIYAWWSQVRLDGNQIWNIVFMHTHIHTYIKWNRNEKKSKIKLMEWDEKRIAHKVSKWKEILSKPCTGFFIWRKTKIVCMCVRSSSSSIESIWLYTHSQWANSHTYTHSHTFTHNWKLKIT